MKFELNTHKWVEKSRSKVYSVPVWVFQAIIDCNLEELNPSQQKLFTAFEDRVRAECGEGQWDIDSTILYAEPFDQNDVTDQIAWCVTMTYCQLDHRCCNLQTIAAVF